MKFDDIDQKMRVFESTQNHFVLPGIWIVARLDGRGFTKLTKEMHSFEVPFDRRFHDFMCGTVEHLMDCGFRINFGYTQSDEISLLFHIEEDAFNRKVGKLLSILSGEASAKFSLLLGGLGVFDCRISPLPQEQNVLDYFQWRAADAQRNALNANCYWLLRKKGASVSQATENLSGMTGAAKHDFLFGEGINFNDLPPWQKRGTGFYWETYEKEGLNPLTGEKVMTKRRRIKRDSELPIKQCFRDFLTRFLKPKP